MQIAQETLDDLKGRVDGGETLDEILQKSIVIGGQGTGALMAEPDCQPFGFDIKVLKISGKIWKSGKLEYGGSVFGVEIAQNTIDLSKGEVCLNPKVGEIAGIKYCFSYTNNCLRTRGEIDGWFAKVAEWDKQIFCF